MGHTMFLNQLLAYAATPTLLWTSRSLSWTTDVVLPNGKVMTDAAVLPLDTAGDAE